MLTTSITLHRKPKNGTDGVGITSADVVFAQSKSSTNPPADTDVWKTNVKELSLVDGYLWSGTKIVYSNKNIAITGKYCIGSTRDFTDIEELYYLSDSGDKIPTNVTFQSSFKPEKGKYLWTCIRYRFKAPSGSAENTNWVYSTPTCAGYFGDDGVSVQSSDVVFAIGENKTTAPTTGWITNFGGLTLAEGKYVWTCTKTILTSSSTPIYTGAYCLGECYDFAQVEELYALSDSSTQAPESGWNASYKVVKGKYLWSCVKVTYNDANISYLNKKCVSYFPNDGVNGTKFTPKGTAYAHYSRASELPSPSVATVNRKYLVDIDDKSTPTRNTPCVCYYKNTTTFMSDVAAEGDAYNIGGTLWVHDGKVWHDFGSVQGPKGDDGEDALNIELSVEKILFNYYEGNFEQKNKTITLIVRQGGNVIKSSDYNVKIVAAQNFDISTGDKLTIAKQDNYCTLNCFSSGVTIYDYTYDNKVSYVSYPASSCSIKIAVEYNGITYFKELSIEVSFVRMYGGLAYDLESLSSTYGELVGDNGRLKQMETQIYQNARNITLTAKRTDGLENQYSEIKFQYDSINISVGKINDGLAHTGINITDGSITMTANKFKLYNNNGDETFSTDADGNGIFKGTINATGGNFGSLQITSFTDSTGFKFYGMYAHTEPTPVIPASTYALSYNGLYIGSGLKDNGGSVHIGNNGTSIGGVFSWDDGVINVDADNSGVSNADISGIGVNVVGNSSHSAIGMKVYATGGKNNYAVYAGKGDFRAVNGAFIGAFCGNVNKGNNGNNVKNDYTLTPTDSIIVCENHEDITIRFPHEGIKAGQMFIVIAGTSSRINFGGEVGYPTSILCQGELYCGTRGQWNFIIFDGKTWHIRMV
nr:MAG TPA: hypothetical protein [Caudoviricetes sp.]